MTIRLTAAERETMGPRLRAARTRANLTMRQVADRCGVSANAVAEWERGSLPGPEHRPALADLYRMPEEKLFAELAAHLDELDRILDA